MPAPRGPKGPVECPPTLAMIGTEPRKEVIGMASVMTPPRNVAAHRPLLGLRGTPGRVALLVFRTPLPLYRRGWGWLLGRTFLFLVHVGRKTGEPHDTVAMVLRYDVDPRDAVICSAWGAGADWVRNLQAHPALEVRIGRDSFVSLRPAR
jgi:hypothetical protein